MAPLYLLSIRHLKACGIRRRGRALLAAASVAVLSAFPVGAQQHTGGSRFTLASLDGAYAYANSLSNVASYGVVRFDGRGGLSVDVLHVNTPCNTCTGQRSITELNDGTGSYQMTAEGTGSLTVTYATINPSTGSPYTFTYEFVVTSAIEMAGGKRLAVNLFSAGTTGGLDGQLFAPTLTRQAMPLSTDGR
jgi:hypothetical protein